jgi:hypothetical protein
MCITQTDRELLGLCILAIVMGALGVLYEQSQSSPVPSTIPVVEEMAHETPVYETPVILKEELDMTSQKSGALEEICRQIEEDTRQDTTRITVAQHFVNMYAPFALSLSKENVNASTSSARTKNPNAVYAYLGNQ